DPTPRRGQNPEDRPGRAFRVDKTPTRILDDAAISEILKIPGVAYVEPDIGFTAYIRCNGKVFSQMVAGASVPNASSRFKTFSAGQMISRADADDAVVSEGFVEACGYAKPAEAVGQTIEFLTTRGESQNGAKDETRKDTANNDDTGMTFFGLPLGEDEAGPPNTVSARSFRIAGVLGQEKREGPAQGGPMGLMFNANLYVPLPAASDWVKNHRNPMSEVALALARQSGQLGH